MKKVIYKIEVFGKDNMGGIDSLEIEDDTEFTKEAINTFILNSCNALSKRGYGVTGFSVQETKTYKVM